MDTPMEMKHVVNKILEVENVETELENKETELDDVKTELEDMETELDNTETEQVLETVPNQPVQQEDSNQSNQSRQRNSTIQELQLTTAATKDPKFSTKTPINWIQQFRNLGKGVLD